MVIFGGARWRLGCLPVLASLILFFFSCFFFSFLHFLVRLPYLYFFYPGTSTFRVTDTAVGYLRATLIR